MDIGTTLQQARIARGLSLADISSTTKMSAPVLQRIEEGSFDQLPGGLLTRGYLRAFAREVGLDPEKIVNEYRAEFERTAPEDEPFQLPRSSYQDSDARTHGGPLALIVALAVVLYFGWVRPSESPTPMATDAVVDAIDVDTTVTLENAVAPQRIGQPGEPSSAAAADSKMLRIQLRPRADCWVSATADGRPVIYRLMHGGELETITALDEIVLRVGDAGALAYVVNGRAGRVLGPSGEAVTVRITSDDVNAWVNTPGEPVTLTPGTISTTHHVGI